MKIEFCNTQGLIILIPTLVIEPNPAKGRWEFCMVWLTRQLAFNFGER